MLGECRGLGNWNEYAYVCIHINILRYGMCTHMYAYTNILTYGMCVLMYAYTNVPIYGMHTHKSSHVWNVYTYACIHINILMYFVYFVFLSRDYRFVWQSSPSFMPFLSYYFYFPWVLMLLSVPFALVFLVEQCTFLSQQLWHVGKWKENGCGSCVFIMPHCHPEIYADNLLGRLWVPLEQGTRSILHWFMAPATAVWIVAGILSAAKSAAITGQA